MRHLYRIYFINGTSADVDSKRGLIAFLKTLEPTQISKVVYYKANGFWVDVTSIYLKNKC
ncbi:MAG: hypothetical protein VR72_02860 [Clostridiaceae bacterium BRH_c20a]|nr:MAG: hypothetical protein VR72_02860 [Clostridiaceae bacterium BRH_c20a]